VDLNGGSAPKFGLGGYGFELAASSMSFLRSRFTLVAAPVAAALYLFYGFQSVSEVDVHDIGTALKNSLLKEQAVDQVSAAPAFTRRIVAVGDLHGMDRS
jgi:hypothetical protein